MVGNEVTRVLFVCLGNICRSPTAHGVFEAFVARHDLSGSIVVDSCGTAHWHVGAPPDERSIEAAAARGYELGRLRARQFSASDFTRFDYILAMDHSNLDSLKSQRPADFDGVLDLFLKFAPEAGIDEVPDPYYGSGDGFNEVLDLIEAASEGLLKTIARR